MGLFTNKSAGAVGLSIEEDTVKYAELQPLSGGRWRIGVWGTRRFGVAQEPPRDEMASPETEAESPEAVVGGGPLMQPWTLGVLNKLKKYPVFASFADRDVLMKFISLPSLSEQEVARMVELRYREYLPMPRADIVFDFSITRFAHTKDEGGVEGAGAVPGEAAGSGEEELRVMVIGLERGAYLGYRETFAGQGIILRSIEANQAALTRGCNFFLGPDHSGTYAVLYINDTYSMINFVVDHGLYYSRLLEHGLQSLTPDDVGKRRADRLLRELYRSVDFFSVESRGIPIETLYLTNGGITPDSGVTRRIQRFLGDSLAVEVVTLQEVIEEDDRLALPSGTAAGTLVLPVGLALRHSRGGGS
jgi:hypothetical protein